MGEKDIMGILENFENAWDPDIQYESSNINKTSSNPCCDGCMCKSSTDHDTEFQMEELDFNI
jgi:uncharacterized protein (DUF1499 family)